MMFKFRFITGLVASLIVVAAYLAVNDNPPDTIELRQQVPVVEEYSISNEPKAQPAPATTTTSVPATTTTAVEEEVVVSPEPVQEEEVVINVAPATTTTTALVLPDPEPVVTTPTEVEVALVEKPTPSWNVEGLDFTSHDNGAGVNASLASEIFDGVNMSCLVEVHNTSTDDQYVGIAVNFFSADYETMWDMTSQEAEIAAGDTIILAYDAPGSFHDPKPEEGFACSVGFYEL